MIDAPFSWPYQMKCAAIISVIFDDGHDAIADAPELAKRKKSLSNWQYGAQRGVERLLSCFSESNITTTWFIPAIVAQKHTELVKMISHQSHHIGGRGINFERYENMDHKDICRHLVTAKNMISDITGKETSGFRLPNGNWPQNMAQHLIDSGYSWSCSLNGDDIPYRHPSGLLEIPVHSELEDRPYFMFNFNPPVPKGLGRIASYQATLDNWIAEFEAYRRYGGCFVLQFRPEVTGTPGRISLIRDFCNVLKSYTDVWISDAAQVFAHCKNLPIAPDKHPIQVYEQYCHEEG